MSTRRTLSLRYVLNSSSPDACRHLFIHLTSNAKTPVLGKILSDLDSIRCERATNRDVSAIHDARDDSGLGEGGLFRGAGYRVLGATFDFRLVLLQCLTQLSPLTRRVVSLLLFFCQHG